MVLHNRTRVTGLTSRDRIWLSAKADLGARPSLTLGVSATNMTACPCMQAYALDDLLTHFAAPDTGNDDPGHRGTGHHPADPARRAAVRAAVPVATHSQKGRVMIAIKIPLTRPGGSTGTGQGEQDQPWLNPTSSSTWATEAAEQLPSVESLYGVLQAGSTLTSEMLKRPDEYDMVKRAHRRAQFVEDVARDTAAAAATQLTTLRGDTDVIVQASSYESIHGHDIEAYLSSSLNQLRRTHAPS